METMDKSFKKIQELQETIAKEFGEVTARNEAIAKLAAMKELQEQVNRNLGMYEKVRILDSPEDWKFEMDGNVREEKHANNQKLAAGILTLIEYAKQNPTATEEDLQNLHISLAPEMDLNTIILIGRCSNIADKYNEAKPRLTRAILNLATRA